MTVTHIQEDTMIDQFWSTVLGTSIELEKVYDFQPDSKIVSDDAVGELSE